MNKTISIIRIAILLATATVTMLCLIAEPLDDSPTWTLDLVISKALAIAAGYITYRLYRRWHNDPLIKRFEQTTNNI